jgi:hypothetical protein
MAIQNYGSKDVAVSYGSAITAMVFPTTDVEREAILQESTPFGVAWKTWVDTGSRSLAPLTFSGIEDFTASTGSRALMAEGTSATLLVTYGGSKTTSVTAIVQKYKSALVSEKLHVFTVTLQPTGTVTEA